MATNETASLTPLYVSTFVTTAAALAAGTLSWLANASIKRMERSNSLFEESLKRRLRGYETLWAIVRRARTVVRPGSTDDDLGRAISDLAEYLDADALFASDEVMRLLLELREQMAAMKDGAATSRRFDEVVSSLQAQLRAECGRDLLRPEQS